MIQLLWSRETIDLRLLGLLGTELIVEGFMAKDGTKFANGRDITFTDGKKLFMGSSGTGAPDERPEK